jgi:hypothetical protein
MIGGRTSPPAMRLNGTEASTSTPSQPLAVVRPSAPPYVHDYVYYVCDYSRHITDFMLGA